jgi:hypothetical protein
MRVPSVVSLRTSANSPKVPIVVSADTQQEYPAKARRLAISGIDCALDKRRKVLDHSRRMGLPVAFIRMINEPAFFNRAIPRVRRIEGFEPCRGEMIFEPSSPSCYSGGASAGHALDEIPADDVHRAISKISGICAEVFETDDWIEQTLPRNLGYGKNAGV